MTDIRSYSDEELQSIASGEPSTAITDASDDELMAIANESSVIKPTASFRQAPEPSVWDRVTGMFRNPQEESAKAVNALVNAKILSERTGMHITPSTAYRWETATTRFLDMKPEEKQKQKEYLTAIQKFNDTGVEDGWSEALWKNVKAIPFHLQVAAGGLLQMVEENAIYEAAPFFNLPEDEKLDVLNLTARKREENEVRSIGQAIAKSGEEKLKGLQADTEPGSWKYYISSAVQSTGNNLAWLLPSLITRNPTYAMVGMGLQATGEEYPRQREGGSNPLVATLASLGYGVAEGLPEFITTGIYLKPGVSLVRKIVEAEFAEIPTETLTTISQNVIDKTTISPDMTLGDALNEIVDTVYVTVFSTIPLAAGSHTVNKLAARDLPPDAKQAFNKTAKEVLNEGGSPQEAAREGIQAAKAVPSGAQHINTILENFRATAQKIAAEEGDAPIQTEEIQDANQVETAIFDLVAEGKDLEAITDEDIAAKIESYGQAPVKPVAETGISEAGVAPEQGVAGQVGTDSMVYRDVFDQLQRAMPAGTPETNIQAQATLWDSFFKTMGQRAGIAPEELYQRYSPLISSGNLQEAPKTLADFVRTEGGISAADEFMKGEVRDRFSIKGGFNLVNNTTGQTLDRLAEAAWEAGYFKERPTVAEFLDSLREDVDAKTNKTGKAVVSYEGRDLESELDIEFAKHLDNQTGLMQDDATGEMVTPEEWSKRYFQSAAKSITETPEFKAWFGDSKVVNEQGEPLVVYHGSPNQFEKFSYDYLGTKGTAEGYGFYFTDKKNIAKGYANASGKIYEVYLKIEKPLHFTEKTITKKQFTKFIQAIDSDGSDYLSNWGDVSTEPYNTVLKKAVDAEYATNENDVDLISSIINASSGSHERVYRILQETLGHDGIIVENPSWGLGQKIYIPFFPENIKSVFNRGTFDPNDARILYQSAYHGTPHKFDKFTLDHIGKGEGAQAYGWGLYFAENKDVANWYKEKLSEYEIITVRDKNGKIIEQGAELSDGSLEATKWLEAGKRMAGQFKHNIGYYAKKAYKDSFARFPEVLEEPAKQAVLAKIEEYANKGATISYEKNKGRLYKVNLVPEKDEYLDWDKPLSEQSEKVKAILEAEGIIDEFRERIYSRPEIYTKPVEQVFLEQTGADFYERLNETKAISNWVKEEAKNGNMRPMETGNSQERISLYLKSIGIPGIKYLEGASRNKGEGHHNFVIFDEELIQIEEYEQAQRGRITFTPEGVNIELLKNADASTFLHETGHLYLKIMGDLAQAKDAPAELKKDLDTLLKWFKVKSVKDIQTKHHEKFARGFEKYLAEGKAPSAELRSAFEQFKNWLIEVYKNLKALNVSLTPEVTAVMDRMLATKSEIDATQKGRDVATEAVTMKSILPTAAVKGQVRRATGLQTTANMIREDEALSAAWKKAEQNARIAFRAGNKEGIAEARITMKESLQRAKLKEAEHEKIAKDIKTLKKLKDKSKGKIAVEYQEAIRQILEGIDFAKPNDDTVLRLTALHDHIMQNGVPLGISQAELNELGRLSQVSIRDLAPDALGRLAETVRKLYDLGKLKKELLDKKEGREQQKALDSLIASTTSLDPTQSGQEEPTRGDIVKAGAAALNIDIQHTFRVADSIDGVKDYAGENASMIKEQMQSEIAAKNESNRRSRSLVEGIQAVMQKAGIDEITEDMQARITINMMVNQGARSQAVVLMEKYGFAEVPALDATELQILALAVQSVGEKTADIADLYQKRENLAFPEVNNYFPIKYVNEEVSIPVPTMIMQDRNRTRQTEQGFTVTRTPGVQKLPRIDFLAIAEEAINAQEWYVNVQPVLDTHAALIRTPEYKLTAGQLASNWWKDQIDIVARRGWSASAKSNPLFRMARMNINQAVLGYKLTTIFMQPFAVFDAVAYATSRWGLGAGKDILAGFGGSWINPKAAMAYVKGNPALNLRQAGEIAIEETMEDIKGKKGAYAAFKKYAMSGIRAADIMTAAGVQKGFLNILKKHGVTGAEAEAEAEFLMNLTNGSSEITVRPHVLARGEGARLWLTFQSFFLNRWGILTHDLMASGYSGNWSRKATALMGLLIMMAGGLAEDKTRELLGLLMGGKVDSESFWKKVFLYIPRQLPAIGGLFEKWGKAEPPLIQTLGKGAKGIQQVGAGKPIAGVENLAESILTVGFGVPGTIQGFDLLDAAVLNDIKKEESANNRRSQ